MVSDLSVKNHKLIQITKSVCGPIVGLAPITKKYDSVWAKECLAFNDLALDYIKNLSSITHVVLSANFSNYLKSNQFVYLTDNGLTESDATLLVKAFNNTLSELKNLGITPIVFSPLPKAGFDVGECLELQYGPVILLREGCTIGVQESEHYQSGVHTFLKKIEQNTKIVWFKDYLCKNDVCQVVIDDTFIYRDEGHFSIDRSRKLLTDIALSTIAYLRINAIFTA